ncbi:OsmC family protein [Elioraea sp.]|uniref:OsmC family protein n=1 Tax=Elioraea sp. TaxID=2185103 RepID=UPI003F72B7DB
MHTETIEAVRLGRYGALLTAGEAEIEADTGGEARTDALGPIGLQLSAVAACLMHTIETLAPRHDVRIDGVAMSVSGDWDETEGLQRVGYHIVLQTDAPAGSVEALHHEVQHHGAVCATLRRTVPIAGLMRRTETAGAGNVEA